MGAFAQVFQHSIEPIECYKATDEVNSAYS